jgi:hypothetical protein
VLTIIAMHIGFVLLRVFLWRGSEMMEKRVLAFVFCVSSVERGLNNVAWLFLVIFEA